MGYANIATLTASKGTTYQCSVSTDGSLIAAACWGKNFARVWDVKTRRCIATLQHDHWAQSSNGMITTAGAGDCSVHLCQ